MSIDMHNMDIVKCFAINKVSTISILSYFFIYHFVALQKCSQIQRRREREGMGVSPPLLFDDSFLWFQEKVRLKFSPILGENVSKFHRFLGENVLKSSPILRANVSKFRRFSGENVLKFSPTLGANIFQSFIRFWEKKSQNFSDSWKKMP
jgi:hypothetical protein